MGGHVPLDDGQAEPDPLLRTSCCPREAIEHPSSVLLDDSGTRVVHGNPYVAVHPRNPDGGAASTMDLGVGHEIGHHPLETPLVHHDDEVRGPGVEGGHRTSRGSVGGSTRQLADVSGLEDEVLTRVMPRYLEEGSCSRPGSASTSTARR